MVRSMVALWALMIALPLLAADPKTPISSFAAGSSWSGTETGDARRPNTPQAASRSASFVVNKLDNSIFTGTIKIGGDTLQLKGRLDPSGNIQAQAVKVMHGTGWDPHILDLPWTGSVNDDVLQLSYTNTRNLVRTLDLTLDTSDGGGGRKKKK